MKYEVIEDLQLIIYEALEEALNREGQVFNGTFLAIWSINLANCFDSGEAIDPEFDGSVGSCWC